jgi:hypothetical protein
MAREAHRAPARLARTEPFAPQGWLNYDAVCDPLNDAEWQDGEYGCTNADGCSESAVYRCHASGNALCLTKAQAWSDGCSNPANEVEQQLYGMAQGQLTELNACVVAATDAPTTAAPTTLAPTGTPTTAAPTTSPTTPAPW